MAKRNKQQPPRKATAVPASRSQSAPATSAGATSTQESSRQIEFRAEAYQGLIPSPGIMAEWQRMIPDAPERLLKMAENQEAHRIRSEHRALTSEIVSGYLGTVSAFIIGVAAIALAAFMVWMGQGLVGLAAFVTALGTLAGVYLYGSKSRKDERLRKARMMAGLPELPPPPSSAKR